MGNDANVSKRDGFRSRGGFIIACIGSAVGMGNIWRFPTLVSKWGGMTFLLPYFLFVILIGSTGVIGEFALGRAAGAGPVDAFGMCTEARWGKRRPGELVGYIPVLGSLALAIGYTCVMGWIFKYTFLAFDGGLSAMGQDMDAIVGSFNATASAWGANVWVVVAVAVSFVIMSFGIAGGRIVAMVFFVCVAFAGVTSIINLYEAPVASLQERFGLKRVPATAVIHVIGLAVALCIQAIVSQWMDVVSIYICPLGALLAAVMFFWIGGKKLVLESVNLGARKPIGGWYYPLCKYVYCASVLVALVAGAALGGIG